jgi:nitroreductase
MMTQAIGSNQHPSLIRTHLSAQSFSARKVDIGKLLRLLEAARWTSSYRNEQPWGFIIASREDPGTYERLLNCLSESNVARARHAPVLILSVVKLNFDDGQRNPYAFHDAGKAVTNLANRAAGMGLLVHQMGGFDAASARESFQIPSGHSPVAVIAVGYADEDTSTDAGNTDETSRVRRPLDSLVFNGRWGDVSPLLLRASSDPCDDRDNN